MQFSHRIGIATSCYDYFKSMIMVLRHMSEREKSQIGPCLICEDANEYSFEDLLDHIRNTHTDQTELIAVLMVKIKNLGNQIKTLGS